MTKIIAYSLSRLVSKMSELNKGFNHFFFVVVRIHLLFHARRYLYLNTNCYHPTSQMKYIIYLMHHVHYIKIIYTFVNDIIKNDGYIYC